MRRKVIRQGHNTLTITLPSKWAADNGITAGSELEYLIEGNSIKISKEAGETFKVYDLDIKAENIMLEREIGSLFKKGYDEIRINSDNPQALDKIQDIIGYSMVGFEVICNNKNSCVIKRVAEIEVKEFDQVMRRMLLQLQLMASGIQEAMAKNDIDSISSHRFMERNNNRYTSFLRRIINKGLYYDPKNDKLIYAMVEISEKIADEYKYLCDYFNSNKDNLKNLPKEVIAFFKDINVLLEETIALFYKFDRTRLMVTFKKRKQLIKQIIEFMSTHGKRDSMVSHYALAISQQVADIMSIILTINH